MAQYILDVSGEIPLWPALKTYNGTKRARFDAAKLLLRKAIYEAMHGESLLDRPIAHELMTWTDSLPHVSLGHIASNSASRFTFSITRVA